MREGRSATGRGGGRLPLLAPLLVVLFASAADVGAQTRAEATGRANDLTTYRRPLGNDPATLDPARISDVYSRAVAEQLFDGLVRFDQTLTITPALAQFWKSSRDGLTWRFTLRKGVKFHHGRELTSDDVVFSLTRLLDPRLRSNAAEFFFPVKGARQFRDGRAASVAGITALDRYGVQVILDEPHAQFVSVLALGHAKILPRDAVEGRGDGFALQPVGTGPFRFVRWDRGKEVVLAANPEYFDGAPAVSRLVFRIFPGEPQDAIYRQFEQGALEDSPLPANARGNVSAPRVQYVRRTQFTARFYGFNTRMKPLDDRRVRQAIVHAVDRDTILREVFLDRYQPARGVVPPGTPGYNPALKPLGYDPARARELLRQAGYPDGRGLPPLVLWSAAKTDRVMKEHELMKRALAGVGVKVDVRYQTDWPAFSKGLSEGTLPIFLYAWFADIPDQHNFLFLLFHSKSPRNLFGYANPTVDDLLVHARGDPDLAHSVELYRRAEQMIVEDAPLLPVWHYVYEHVFQPYVRSVEVNGLGDPYLPLRKISLDRR